MKSIDKKNAVSKSSTSVEFRPAINISGDKLHRYRKISLRDLAGIGAILAELNPAFRTVTITENIHVEGLWKCTFPEGISGTLAKAKDGSGFLGTILSPGIVGQARLNPVEFVSSMKAVTIPISPVNLFMAVTMIEMDKKLDHIQKMGEEIQEFLIADKESMLRGDIRNLERISKDCKYHLDNRHYLEMYLSEIRVIWSENNKQVDLIHSQISRDMDKHTPRHSDKDTRKMIQEVYRDFQWYQMAVYTYSYARCFEVLLEILLGDRILKKQLYDVGRDIRQWEKAYQQLYNDCYFGHDGLRYSARTTSEEKKRRIMENVGKNVKRIPGSITKQAGKSLVYKGTHRTRVDEALWHFKNDMRDSGSMQFVNFIDGIGHLYNDPSEVLIDKNYLYLS